MAKRPDSHITGDNAVRQIIANLIPEEWTWSIPEADYGLDLMVEVVSNNETTGKLFFIQSKGTSDSMTCGKITYSLSMERINDYSKIELPVLFVYHSKTDNKFWGRWMNPVYDTLDEEQRRQKSLSLIFTQENEITKEYLLTIKSDICLKFSRQIALRLKEDVTGFPLRMFRHLAMLSKHCIGEEVTTDLHLVGATIDVSFVGNINGGTLILLYKDDKLEVPLNITNAEVLYYPRLSDSDCPKSIQLAVLAIALLSSKFSVQSRQFILENVNTDLMKEIPEEEWLKFVTAVHQEDRNKCSRFFNAAVNAHYDQLIQFLILDAFVNMPVLYREYLHYYLSKAGNDNMRGTLCYNLANAVRNENMYEAASLYIKAAKLKPVYREQYYWWQELAGVMYCTGHYFFAERFYRHAQILASEFCREDIELMISDCLVSQGKYEAAMHEESIYADKTIAKERELSACYFLRAKVTSEMFKNALGVVRNIDCYNKALLSYNKSNYSIAKWWFLYAWRVNDGDLESLGLAAIAAFSANELNDMSIILSTIITGYGEAGYKQIVHLFTNSDLPSELVEHILDGIAKLL